MNEIMEEYNKMMVGMRLCKKHGFLNDAGLEQLGRLEQAAKILPTALDNVFKSVGKKP